MDSKEALPYVKLTTDVLLKLYTSTLNVLQEGIRVGKTDGPIGLMSFMAYCDLLHGGAYTKGIQFLPHYAPDPTISPYYVKGIKNLAEDTWLSWLSENTVGECAKDMMNEVWDDANVPHVFPKFLSDQMYAQLKLAYAQVMTADIFLKGSTGITTLVEGLGTGIEHAGAGIADVTEAQTKSLQALLKAAPAAMAVIP